MNADYQRTTSQSMPECRPALWRVFRIQSFYKVQKQVEDQAIA